MKTCCFTGHRPQKLGYGENSIQCDELKGRLEELIKNLIEKEGVTHFISGVALGVEVVGADIKLDQIPVFVSNSYPRNIIGVQPPFGILWSRGVRTKSWTPLGLRKELNQHVFTR